jgi:hypothetical protein
MRADEFETADFISTRDDIKFEIWPVDNPEKITRIKAKKILKQINSPIGNLFCLYSLDMSMMEENKEIRIDARLKKNSDAFLIIKDVPQFLQRLRKALDEKGGYWEHHMVEYIDFSNYYGERTFFQKDKTYEYQNEFRLFIEHGKDEPISISVGDISDISIKFSCSILDKAVFVKSSNNLL